MAPDRSRSLTDDEIEALLDDVQELRETVLRDLADDFGGDSEDYRADRPVPDGGDD